MINFYRGILATARRRRPARRRPHPPAVEGLDRRLMLDAGIGYVQTNLVSDVKGLAPHRDPNLQNPWGFSETPDGQFRVSDNGTGLATLYNAEGKTVGPAVTIPTPPGVAPPASPNGNLVNDTQDFVISHGRKSAPATVLFSTEDGTIAGWNPRVDRKEAVIGADQSGDGAIFKLVAMGTAGGANYLYATDFHNGVVDVFDKDFKLTTLSPGQFTDPDIPAGFAPFGIKDIDGTLFVTFAKQDDDRKDDVAGVGNGFIDEFDTSGHLLGRFASQGMLNSPIGMAVAPDNFGQFSNALLVGNFGDSRVNAFDLKTGAFLGQLTDAQGNPMVLNGGFQETDQKGLWGIGFGNGENGAATNSLFFAAGINEENDGVFGKVTVNGEDSGRDGVAVKAPQFSGDFTGPKLAELNAVAASGTLLRNGSFKFVGVNQGAINPNVAATFVFGVDRDGHLPAGPLDNRPDIRFDALVTVNVMPGMAPTASVTDLVSHQATSLSPRSIHIEGHMVAVNVPGSLLPSTGLPPAQYRFNYWTEDPDPTLSQPIASFAPEFNDAQVGVAGGQDGLMGMGMEEGHRRSMG